MRIGRNEPCPCGSGKKYKRCCGDPLKETASPARPPYPRPLPPELRAILEQRKAADLIREQQQGLGRPIMSVKLGDQQVVAVGNTVYRSVNWKTMVDFLGHYIKAIFSGEWGNAEIKKPYAERHPIMQWYHDYCMYQQKVLGLRKPGEAGQVKSSTMTGIVYCYMGLAYGLFLLNNNAELQERLIKRLKDPKQFQGAYYEVMIANILIRAGFDLTLEDETDATKKHCEFAAVSKLTGKKYWIEAKSRGVNGLLGKTAADGAQPNSDPTAKITDHINQALEKPADSERMIFVEVNAEPSPPGIVPPWTVRAGKRLDMKEKALQPGQNAYVFVTNLPFHRALESEQQGHVLVSFGLGMPDFGKEGYLRLSEMHRRRKKHADAYTIIEAFQKYPQIPITFDGSMPSSVTGKPYEKIIIGQTYKFAGVGDGTIEGTVTTATVLEAEKTMYLAVTTKDGLSYMLTQPMTDEALADWKAHPQSFFGVVQHVSKNTEDPYELFLFFLNSYKDTSKEKLLEFMSSSPNIASLREMTQEDLAIEYAEGIASNVITKHPKK